MGTNYYAQRNKVTICEPIHIGKSSGGWLFLFQTQNQRFSDPPIIWNSYDELKEWLRKYVVETKEYVILDEYDRTVQYDELIEIIDKKQNDKICLSNPENFMNCKNIKGYRFVDRDFG